jgi:hypothetical protein
MSAMMARYLQCGLQDVTDNILFDFQMPQLLGIKICV